MLKDEIIPHQLKDIKFRRLRNKLSFKNEYINNLGYDWKSLEKSLKNGYNPEKYGYVMLSKDGYILDGHHRITILQHIDKDGEILIKKSFLSYDLGLFIFTLVSPLLLIIFIFQKLSLPLPLGMNIKTKI